MITLSTLENSLRPRRQKKRVGRGTGSKKGKTSGRGGKGDSARSGFKNRWGHEGGQKPLYRRVPDRGFTRGPVLRRLDALNLGLINDSFHDGDVVNEETLRARGLIGLQTHGVKILGDGAITKKLSFEVNAMSASAKAKLEQAGLTYSIVDKHA